MMNKRLLGLTSDRPQIGGRFRVWKTLKSGIMVMAEEVPNIVPNSALNYILNSSTYAGSTAQHTAWYVGLLNNYTPVAGSTMTNLGSATNEFAAYDEGARQAWTPNGASTAQLVSNSTAPAVFTSTGTGTVYGAFICSASTLNETASQVLAAAMFTTAKSLDAGDTLTIQYDLGASSTT